MRIHKYELARMHRQTINMPAGATIISAQEQHGVVVIWAIVEPGINEIRTIVCYSTGDEIDDGLIYVGTAQLHHGNTVVHVFEDTARSVPQP